MKSYFEGLRFGMLLQLAIGPMCLMVFNTAQNSGFFPAFSLVLAIALVDAFYIALAALGAGRLLEKERAKKLVPLLGGAVLLLFGLNIALGAFGRSFIPGLGLDAPAGSLFLQGLLLTLFNPLTVVFWGSVLTAKIVEDGLKSKELTVFSAGAVSATLLFLTAVALLGTGLRSFIPETVSAILNVLVGLLIAGFGARMVFKKK